MKKGKLEGTIESWFTGLLNKPENLMCNNNLLHTGNV